MGGRWELLVSESNRADSVIISDIEDDLLEVFHCERATVKRSQAEAIEIANRILRANRSFDLMVEALQQAREYFDGRADADHNGISFVPNEEMSLQLEIEAALKAAGALPTSHPFPNFTGFRLRRRRS